jgi:hypothetical protein
MKIYTINKVPNCTPRNNPFIGVLWETSLIPEVILAQDYEKKIMEWLNDEKIQRRGTLIGWFYYGDIMPSKEEYMELVHIAAKNGYYKELKL